MAGFLGNQRMWKGLFVLGFIAIAGIVMQYVVIGNFDTTFPSVRQGLVIRVSRVYDLAGSDVYIANHNPQDNSSDEPARRVSRESTLQLKDDVFLEWSQENKVALAVFILSAVSANTSIPSYKYVLKLNGWEALKHRRYVFKCCVRWKNNKKSIIIAPNRTYWKRTSLAATQYSCPIRGHPRDVKGVTIEFNRKRCPKGDSHYAKPFLPMEQKQDSFAICAKIVYGNVDNTLLVDWIEYYRELKVDKIIMFVYNVSEPALRVLRHYSLGKFVEIRQFDFPWKSGHLSRDVGVKNNNAWQDEQVVVFDCYERLRGYTYIAIVDLDEFIVPKRQKTLKDMMRILLKQYPQSAGFTFRSYLFIKNWGKVVTNNGSDIVQYYKRTGAVYTRYKNVMIPDRVQDGSVCTHEFLPKPSYKRIILPEHLAIMHHYRYCYSDHNKTCAGHRILDHSIDKIVNRIRERTTKVLQTVQG